MAAEREEWTFTAIPVGTVAADKKDDPGRGDLPADPDLSGNINEMLDEIEEPDDARKMMQDMNVAFVSDAVEKAKLVG